MEVAFPSKSGLRNENTTRLWVKSTHKRTLTHLPTQFQTFIMRYGTMASITTSTTRRGKLSTMCHPRVQKSCTRLMEWINVISNNKLTPLMICRAQRESLDPQDRICFCSICPTTWKTHNCICFLKNLVIFYRLGWWPRKMENPKELVSSASKTPAPPPKPSTKWTASKSGAKDSR